MTCVFMVIMLILPGGEMRFSRERVIPTDEREPMEVCFEHANERFGELRKIVTQRVSITCETAPW